MQNSWVQTIKLFFLQLTGLSRDALHVYAGMLVFVVGAALLRKRLHSPIPWLLVLVVACGMEALDARDDMQLFGYWRTGASLHDIVNTALWPTIIFLICRYTGLAHKP
jgi:hypothetical protein